MEQASAEKGANEADDDDLDMNPVGLLQKRHTEPLHSHEIFLMPEVQPHSPAAARGCNPWTGQTADEVREAAFSQHQFEQMQKEKKHGKVKDMSPPASPQKQESQPKNEFLEELDEFVFDTAM